MSVGGRNAPSANAIDTMEYISIPSEGDTTDFGNLTQSSRDAAGLSNGHGGL